MIDLTRYETNTQEAADNQHQWPVRYVAAYTSGGAPAKIFVMHASPSPDVYGDSMSCVASAIQMTDLPADAPSEGSPFYRVNDVTKLCRSAKAAAEFIEKVEFAAQDLVDNLHAASALTVTTEVTITPSAT